MVTGGCVTPEGYSCDGERASVLSMGGATSTGGALFPIVMSNREVVHSRRSGSTWVIALTEIAITLSADVEDLSWEAAKHHSVSGVQQAASTCTSKWAIFSLMTRRSSWGIQYVRWITAVAIHIGKERRYGTSTSVFVLVAVLASFFFFPKGLVSRLGRGG